MTTEAGRAALDAVAADERERDLAVTSDEALVCYEAKWQRKLGRLQRAHPQRWRVPGLSAEEVRDSLTLRLIEVVRAGRAAHEQYDRPGKEWGLAVAQRHLQALRRSFRLAATPMDLRGATLPQRGAASQSQEERLLEKEADDGRTAARLRAESRLTQPQRRWLGAMTLAASRGGFFDASAELNLSAASRLLGRNRSSAQRAYKQLQARFRRELSGNSRRPR